MILSLIVFTRIVFALIVFRIVFFWILRILVLIGIGRILLLAWTIFRLVFCMAELSEMGLSTMRLTGLSQTMTASGSRRLLWGQHDPAYKLLRRVVAGVDRSDWWVLVLITCYIMWDSSAHYQWKENLWNAMVRRCMPEATRRTDHNKETYRVRPNRNSGPKPKGEGKRRGFGWAHRKTFYWESDQCDSHRYWRATEDSAVSQQTPSIESGSLSRRSRSASELCAIVEQAEK